MRLQRRIGSCCLAAAMSFTISASMARGQHADISPRVENGRIVADAYDDALGAIVETNVSIFEYDFQEDPFDPFFISDPGLNAISGSGLPQGGRFGFDLVNGVDFGLVGNAVYWDGAGPVSFGSLPAGVSLRLKFGSQQVTVSDSTGPQAGFFFGSAIGANGTFHHHLESWLDGATVGDDDGIYLIGMRFKVDSDGQPPLAGDLFSDPIWIVYNNGLSEEQHEEATHWVHSNLVVPEPGGAMLLALAGAGGVLAQRRGCGRTRHS